MPRKIEISSSKSLLNRALILQSYSQQLKLNAQSGSEDSDHLQEGLSNLHSGREFFVGEGGTTLRFLALRVSRIPGVHTLRGKESLFHRPQAGLKKLLMQLGVSSKWKTDRVEIESTGWKIPDFSFKVEVQDSSQFVSSLVLNSWELPQDLKFHIDSHEPSESYFDMTLKLCEKVGLEFQEHSEDDGLRSFLIRREQKLKAQNLTIEMDMSSAFTMAAFAALNEDLELSDYPFQSDQPDIEFMEFFKQMGIRLEKRNSSLVVLKTDRFHSLNASLRNCPDLFPVLAVLCSQAEGVSRLSGAPQLVHKESNRLKKTKELLDLCDLKTRDLEDGIEVFGSQSQRSEKTVVFDPASDHRLAMAAALLKSVGFKIEIQSPQVVKKSFSDFWELTGVQP